MITYLKNGIDVNGNKIELLIQDDLILEVNPGNIEQVDKEIDLENKLVTPGFIDVHVHLREPGFEQSEDIESGTAAAAKGGYTQVLAMPNLNPVPDSTENMEVVQNLINQKAIVGVEQVGAVSPGLKTGLTSLDYARVLSNDGHPISDEDIEELFKRISGTNKILTNHCEDQEMVNGGTSYLDISNESEYAHIKRDVELAKKYDVKYNVCHISTKEGVAIIEQAKQEGYKVSCEVTPHHLVLNSNDIDLEDGNYKMNPPIRSKEDQEALIQGLNSKAIEIIATDHAPHPDETKNKGFASNFGIIGMESAFAIVYTKLVKNGIVELSTVVDALTKNPARIFELEKQGELKAGYKANITVIDLEASEEITKDYYASKSSNSPFIGEVVNSKIIKTIYQGEVVYESKI